MAKPIHALPERVQAKIAVRESGCWEWVAARHLNGYGAAGSQTGRGGMPWLAHRLVYTLLVGPIPEGMQIDHFVCNWPPCVNPSHLRVVTPRENVLRAEGSVAARNAAKVVCPQGHPLAEGNLVPNVPGRQCLTCRNRRESERTRRQRAGRPFQRGLHMRWHVNRGMVNPECGFCAQVEGATA